MTTPFPSVCSFLSDLAAGEDSGKLSNAVLKNGHTAPIGSARSSSPVQAEEEPGRTASFRKPVLEEDPKKRLGKKFWIFKSNGLIILVYFMGLQESGDK